MAGPGETLGRPWPPLAIRPWMEGRWTGDVFGRGREESGGSHFLLKSVFRTKVFGQKLFDIF
jgi:hypothetical protein